MIKFSKWQSGFALLVGLGMIIAAVTHLVLAAPKLAQPQYADVRGASSGYFVDIKGSDESGGTQSSPWRTLNKALSSIPAGQEATIQVGAGTFDLGGKVSVPSGVKLVGSGIDATTVMGEIELVGVKNITISGLKLNGNNYKYLTAFYIRDSSQINLRNLAFNKYKSQAINMERTSNSEIANLDISDCTFNQWKKGGGGTQTRAIDVGNLTNVKIHDITINTLTRGGQGIGSVSDSWPKKRPWDGPVGILRNVKFYNLDIKVDKWNAWWTGWTPQMALELWHHNCFNCEIYNSTFNSTLSLSSFITKKPTSISVHHNLWYGPNNPFYACEVSSDNIEFDHNYIRGGSYPIAMFGNGYKNVNVHHNIFEKTKSPTLVGHFMNKMENFKFVNNTVFIENSKAPLFYFAKGEASNQQIRNNIFYNSGGKINNEFKASVGLENNLFFKIKPVGSRAMTFDPKLKLSGDLNSQYYMPKSDSLIVKRNLGAIQAGEPVWIVGRKTSTAAGNS